MRGSWEKEQKRQRRVPTVRLAKWARADYLTDLVENLLLNVCRAFGAFRLITLFVAGYAVFWARPSEGFSAWSAVVFPTVRDWLADPASLRFIPFALLFFGLIVVFRRVPLIDRIRARDEAAKDANKYLAEMYGALTRLNSEIYHWVEKLEGERDSLVNALVLELTNDEYEWHYGGGIGRPKGWNHRRLDMQLDEVGSYVGMEEAIRRLTEVREALADKGLLSVARRLTSRVGLSVDELGLLMPPSAGPYGTTKSIESQRLQHELCLPSRIKAAASNKGLTVLAIYKRASEGKELDRKRLESALEKDAYDFAELIEEGLVDVRTAWLHARRVPRFLNRRLTGTWWTRSLSVVQK